MGDQRPRDSKSQPNELIDDARAALREDTAQRLTELLNQLGVNGTLIIDHLCYDVEDDFNHNKKNFDYVGESKTLASHTPDPKAEG